jgi:hypothetical protein
MASPARTARPAGLLCAFFRAGYHDYAIAFTGVPAEMSSHGLHILGSYAVGRKLIGVEDSANPRPFRSIRHLRPQAAARLQLLSNKAVKAGQPAGQDHPASL